MIMRKALTGPQAIPVSKRIKQTHQIHSNMGHVRWRRLWVVKARIEKVPHLFISIHLMRWLWKRPWRLMFISTVMCLLLGVAISQAQC